MAHPTVRAGSAPEPLAAVRELLDKAAVDTELLGRSRRPAGGGARVPVLPVAAPLREVLPAGGVAKGSTVAVGSSVSLLFALLAHTSAEGSWCALVGMPEVGLVAAREAGLDLSRLALVPDPSDRLAAVASALLEGVEVVVLGPARRLGAGNRQAVRHDRSGVVAHARRGLPRPDLTVGLGQPGPQGACSRPTGSSTTQP